MNRERLDVLHGILKMVDKFDVPFEMTNWISSEPCGTACCALGHAAFWPAFQAEGLAMQISYTSSDAIRPRRISTIAEYEIVLGSLRDDTERNSLVAYPTFEGNSGYDAGQAFFDISHTSTVWIFDPDSYPERTITPHMVREHIAQVIACNGQIPDVWIDAEHLAEARSQARERAHAA